MRIRSWSVLGTFFLLAVATPLPARAGIIELIDAWSGPGPFLGYGWEWRLACLTQPGERPGENETSPGSGIGRARLSLGEAREALKTAETQLAHALELLRRAQTGPGGSRSATTDAAATDAVSVSLLQAIDRTRDAQLAVETAQRAVDEAERLLFFGFVGPGCFLTPKALDPRKHRVASVNVGFGLYKSKDNPLFTGETTVIDGETVSTVVRLSTIDLTTWWRPFRSLELGTGGGVMWIGGDAFEPFRRVYLRPGIVDIKPIAAIHDLDRSRTRRPWGSKDELVTVRLGLHVIPKGFTAADFGSTADWRVAREVNWTASVFFDLEPLFRKHTR